MKTIKTMEDIYVEMTKIAEARDSYKQMFFESTINNDEAASKVFSEKYKSLDYMFNYLAKIEVEYVDAKD